MFKVGVPEGYNVYALWYCNFSVIVFIESISVLVVGVLYFCYFFNFVGVVFVIV